MTELCGECRVNLKSAAPANNHGGGGGVGGGGVEFTSQKFNNFRVFLNFFQEISLPFVPDPKSSEFLVEWKAPNNNFG